ncbi:hypothetical protein KCU65_g305, partial [Aureobasidium melanogenum]
MPSRTPSYVNTSYGADLLPPIFYMCVIARSQSSTTRCGPHEVAYAEIKPASVKVVELKLLYPQRVKYRQIRLKVH